MPSPETVRLVSLVAVFLLLALTFVKPFYGLLSYFGVMTLRIGLYYPSLGKIRIELLIALIILIQIFVSSKIVERLKFDYNLVNKYMFFFFLVIMASFVQAWDYAESWDYVVIEFIKIYAFYIMILCLVETEDQVRALLWAFAFYTIFMGYEGIYLYCTGGETYVFQGVNMATASEGFAAGHVAAANMQLQCLPIMIYLMLSEKKVIFKLLGGLLSFLSILGVIASGSRGGFLGLIIIAGLTVYFAKRKGPALLVCGICCLAVIPFMHETYLSWMESIISHSDDSASSRITGLINGIEMMIRRPILGVGPGCYPLARKAWFGWGLESHNHYGQVMGDLGLLGTVVWGFFIVHVFKNLKDGKKKFEESGQTNLVFIITGIQVALIVRLFEGMFSHSLYIFFWYIMAAISIVIFKLSGEKAEQKAHGASA